MMRKAFSFHPGLPEKQVKREPQIPWGKSEAEVTLQWRELGRVGDKDSLGRGPEPLPRLVRPAPFITGCARERGAARSEAQATEETR